MLRVLPTLLLSGCCCCWPFGGDDGSGGFVSDYVSEVVGEEMGERAVEAMTGAENVEIGEDGSFTATGPDGETIEMRTDDDGQMVMTTGDGTLTIGSGEIPDGFPVEPFPESTVVSVMDMADGQLVTLAHGGTKEEILAHYRSQLETLGTVDVAMDMATPDGGMTSLVVQQDDGPSVSVMIMIIQGEDNSSTITVTP